MCLGQVRSDQSGHVLDSVNVGLAVGGTSITTYKRGIDFTTAPTGPTPGAARTPIPDFSGKTVIDVAAVYGWTGTDDNSAIETALSANDGTGNVVFFKKQAGDWETDSPVIVSDLNDIDIVWEEGANCNMGTGAWGAGTPDDLFRFDGANNLRWYGYGNIFDMDKNAFTSGEHAMGFIANNSSNIEVWGGRIQDTGGDGIYINDWTNYKVMDIISNNNSRQGLSIIDAVNGTVDGCVFSNTAPNGVGAASAGPWDGVDFEPNNNTQDFDNITIRNSDMLDNDAAMLDFAWGNFDGGAVALDITIQDCYASGNHQNIWTTGTGENRFTCASGMTGTVNLSRIFMDGSDYPGIYSIMEADGPLITYEDAVLYATNTTAGYASIRLRRIGAPCSDETTLGGIFFDNTTIYNNVDDDLMDVSDLGASEVFKNVTGNIKGITSFTSKTISYKDGYDSGDNVNVTVSLDMDSGPPTTTLSIAAINDVAAEDTQNDGLLRITRTSSEVDYALPVRVAYSGTATIRDDYHGLPSGFVIPAGASTFDITIVPRNDEWTNPSAEGNETVIVTIQAMTDAYTIGTASASVTIKETL